MWRRPDRGGTARRSTTRTRSRSLRVRRARTSRTSWSPTRRRANDLAAQLAAGADFAELARRQLDRRAGRRAGRRARVPRHAAVRRGVRALRPRPRPSAKSVGPITSRARHAPHRRQRVGAVVREVPGPDRAVPHRASAASDADRGPASRRTTARRALRIAGRHRRSHGTARGDSTSPRRRTK